MKRRTNLWSGVFFVIILAIGILPNISESEAAASTIYRLNQQSTYQEGCFPPCLCPISQPTAVRGTFILTPAPAAGLFATYQVSEVNWMFQLGSQQTLVTGSGTYEIGGTPLQQRLQLDLVVGNQGTIHYDSGLVPAKAPFPDIVVSISIHGERCFDQVFAINAAPAPEAAIHAYQLVTGSSFQLGCFPPCECALGPKQPLGGTFTLVDLAPTPLFSEHALVNIKWLAAAPPQSIPVVGAGFYRLGGEVAVQQEMSLELAVGNLPLTLYDSGLVQTKAIFPLIDATISIPGDRCLNTVMVVKAASL